MDTLEATKAVHSFLESWALGVFLGVVACDVLLHLIGDSSALNWRVSWSARTWNIKERFRLLSGYLHTGTKSM